MTLLGVCRKLPSYSIFGGGLPEITERFPSLDGDCRAIPYLEGNERKYFARWRRMSGSTLLAENDR